MRNFYQCVCIAASLWLAQASAHTPATEPVAPITSARARAAQPAAIDLSQLGSQLGSPALTISENLPRNRSIDSIAGDAALFTQTFDPSMAYALGKQSATWLYFRVLADDKPSPTGWTLELPKSYIDRVEFYYKDSRGAWQMQAAGDRIAHAKWPLQGLYPQFALPEMAAGVHDFYLKIQGEVPLHFSVNLQQTDAANVRNQNRFFLGGLLVGVCALMLAFSGMLAFGAGHTVYRWYALFIGLSCLATATIWGWAATRCGRIVMCGPSTHSIVWFWSQLPPSCNFAARFFCRARSGLGGTLHSRVLRSLLLQPLACTYVAIMLCIGKFFMPLLFVFALQRPWGWCCAPCTEAIE